MPDQTAISFTVGQRASLLAWDAKRPLGLGARLTVDADEVFEVAEVYHRDTNLVLWMLFAIKGGVIVLSGADSDEWESNSVEAALERILDEAEGHGVLLERKVAIMAHGNGGRRISSNLVSSQAVGMSLLRRSFEVPWSRPR